LGTQELKQSSRRVDGGDLESLSIYCKYQIGCPSWHCSAILHFQNKQSADQLQKLLINHTLAKQKAKTASSSGCKKPKQVVAVVKQEDADGCIAFACAHARARVWPPDLFIPKRRCYLEIDILINIYILMYYIINYIHINI